MNTTIKTTARVALTPLLLSACGGENEAEIGNLSLSPAWQEAERCVNAGESEETCLATPKCGFDPIARNLFPPLPKKKNGEIMRNEKGEIEYVRQGCFHCGLLSIFPCDSKEKKHCKSVKLTDGFGNSKWICQAK
ncbi:MAG: hypothetical protein AAF471_03255 [Myxococcota bacterium]